MCILPLPQIHVENKIFKYMPINDDHNKTEAKARKVVFSPIRLLHHQHLDLPFFHLWRTTCWQLLFGIYTNLYVSKTFW